MIDLISFDNVEWAPINSEASKLDKLPVKDCGWSVLKPVSCASVVKGTPVPKVEYLEVRKESPSILNSCQNKASKDNQCEANMVVLQLGGVKFMALMDTGGGLSLVNQSLLKQWDPDFTVQKLSTGNFKFIRSVTGQNIPLLGVVPIKLNLSGFALTFPFYVCSNVPFEMILGADFLEFAGARLDYSQLRLILGPTISIPLERKRITTGIAAIMAANILTPNSGDKWHTTSPPPSRQEAATISASYVASDDGQSNAHVTMQTGMRPEAADNLGSHNQRFPEHLSGSADGQNQTPTFKIPRNVTQKEGSRAAVRPSEDSDFVEGQDLLGSEQLPDRVPEACLDTKPQIGDSIVVGSPKFDGFWGVGDGLVDPTPVLLPTSPHLVEQPRECRRQECPVDPDQLVDSEPTAVIQEALTQQIKDTYIKEVPTDLPTTIQKNIIVNAKLQTHSTDIGKSEESYASGQDPHGGTSSSEEIPVSQGVRPPEDCCLEGIAPSECVRPPEGHCLCPILASVANVVNGAVGDDPLEVLIDTGAGVSIIASSFCNSNDILCLQSRKAPKIEVAKAVNGNEVALEAIIQVPLEIGDRLILQDMYIVNEELQQPVILGMDFLKGHCCKIDLATEELRIDGNDPIPLRGSIDLQMVIKVQLTEDSIVPGRTQRVVYAKTRPGVETAI
jgi:hypothetical protein